MFLNLFAPVSLVHVIGLVGPRGSLVFVLDVSVMVRHLLLQRLVKEAVFLPKRQIHAIDIILINP
jgi:hypothetical protein